MTKRKIKIQSSTLPSIYPIGFNDELIFFEYNKMRKISPKFQDAFTEWKGEEDIKVQSIIHDKYECSIYVNEELLYGAIDLLKSENITITKEGFDSINATIEEIEDVEYEADIAILSFTFIDKDSKKTINYHDYENYPELLSNANTTQFFLDNSEIIDVEFTNNSPFVLKSNLSLLLSATDTDLEVTDQNGIEVPFRGINFKTASCKFFVDETTMAFVMKYAPICDSSYFNYDGNNYNIIEQPDVRSQEIGEGWHAIEITAKYEQLDYDYYK